MFPRNGTDRVGPRLCLSLHRIYFQKEHLGYTCRKKHPKYVLIKCLLRGSEAEGFPVVPRRATGADIN